MNAKFLQEAIEIGDRWKTMFPGLDDRFSRASCAVLLESQRFRYECESDDDYEEYLADFNGRMRHALGQTNYTNPWLKKRK